MEPPSQDIIDNLKYSLISSSDIHGFGLFSNTNIQKNTVLGILDGQTIPWALHTKLDLTLEWNAVDEEMLLVRPYRTKYSYINHSRNPNLVLLYNPLRVSTLKDIKNNNEMTLDYRNEPLPQEYIENKGKNYL